MPRVSTSPPRAVLFWRWRHRASRCSCSDTAGGRCRAPPGFAGACVPRHRAPDHRLCLVRPATRSACSGIVAVRSQEYGSWSGTVTEPCSTSYPTSRRYLALWFPYLTADRWRHERGAASDGLRPLVFVERSRGTARIAATCLEARQAGLRAGMTLADARARMPQLQALPMDADADARWIGQRLRDLGAFSPSVALDPPGGLALDITGCANLFGGEASLIVQIDRLMHARGAAVRAAIGETPDMARALARFGPQRLGIAAGEGIRELSVAALEAAPETILALRRAGLRTLAHIIDRPSVLFTSRFGKDLVGKLDRIIGKEDRRLSPDRPLPPLVFEARCAEPIARDVEIMGVLETLVAEAIGTLDTRGEGGRVFVATFFRTDNTQRSIHIETGQPERQAATILLLFKERLDALADPLDPGFGFDAMRLAVPHAEPLVQGQVTLDTRDHQDEGVSALIDRLAVRFGAHAIQSLEPCDAHLPEHTQCVVLGGSGRDPRAWPSPAPGPSPARPLHLFDPAQPIEMAPLSSEDEPSRFRWRRVRHLIRKAQGPERIAAPWWSTALPPPTRDYWRVEIDDGRRYWLFRQTGGGADDRWFLHGVFA